MMKADSNYEFFVTLFRSLRPTIMASYGAVEHTIKDNATPVTEIDKLVELELVAALSRKFPDIGFHGEEHGKKGDKKTYWLIDPVDGTENYIRGLPGVTSIVGLVRGGKVVESYIYDPVNDELYWAVKGCGAFVGDRSIHVIDRPLHRSFIALSSGFDSGSLLPEAVTRAGIYYMTKFLGAGIKAVYLASGKIDGVIIKSKRSGGEWDYAPTRFLAQEAGAVFTTFDGDRLDTKVYALLSPSVHDEIIDIIKETINA